jgi:hypothetical protein
MRKLVFCTLAGVMMFGFVCSPALAQTTGTIRGQIKDADGSPLGGCLFFLLWRLLLCRRINNRGGSGEQQAYFGLPRSSTCFLAAL